MLVSISESIVMMFMSYLTRERQREKDWGRCDWDRFFDIWWYSCWYFIILWYSSIVSYSIIKQWLHINHVNEEKGRANDFECNIVNFSVPDGCLTACPEQMLKDKNTDDNKAKTPGIKAHPLR